MKLNVAHAMLHSPKLQKTNTEKDNSQSLVASSLKKISPLLPMVQSEKHQQEELRKHHFAFKAMQTTPRQLENVSLISVHAQQVVDQVLESVTDHNDSLNNIKHL